MPELELELMGGPVALLGALLPQIVGLIFFGFVINAPVQAQELQFLWVVEPVQHLREILFSTAYVLFLSATVYFTARDRIINYINGQRSKLPLKASVELLRWPYLLALLPAWLVLASVLQCIYPTQLLDISFIASAGLDSWIYLVVLLLAPLIATYLLWIIQNRFAAGDNRQLRIGNGFYVVPVSFNKALALLIFSLVSYTLTLAAFSLGFILFSGYFGLATYLERAATLGGTFGLVTLFSTAVLVSLHIVANLSRRAKAMVGLSIVAVGLPTVFFDLNNHHGVPLIKIAPGSTAEQLRKLPVEDVIERWLDARMQAADFKGNDRPFPIFVASAQGGGLYAAYHAATALAETYDRCSLFSDHLFGVSAVSGGAWGAAAFSGLVPVERTRGCSGEQPSSEHKTIGDQVDLFFRRDFLSPVVSWGLWYDLPLTFIPVEWLGLKKLPDRALAFEQMLRLAWADSLNHIYREGQDTRHFSQPVSDVWSTGGRRPLVIMNASNAETAGQFVISPVGWPRHTGPRRFSRSFAGIAPNDDVVISTGVSLSARFPIVFPVGDIELFDSEANQLVRVGVLDGGYFDFSGARAANELAQEIRRVTERAKYARKFEVFIILIAADYSHFFLDKSLFPQLNRMLSPIRAIEKARVRRGYEALDNVRRLWESRQVIEFTLNDATFDPGLGLQLSGVTFNLINERVSARGNATSAGWRKVVEIIRNYSIEP